jgi:uncharacterized protein YbjQ (UPF0145 family)
MTEEYFTKAPLQFEVAISTTMDVPWHRITAYHGPVFGVVVRSMGFAKGIVGGLRGLAGGEVKEYTTLLEDSRRHAVDRLVQNAKAIGANGVVGMRFDSSEIGTQFTEIVAYGTAVSIEAVS